MSRLGKQVIFTVDKRRHRILVAGVDLEDLMVLADISHTTTPSGAAVIGLDDLSDLEVACAVRHRPVRIQSRTVAHEI